MAIDRDRRKLERIQADLLASDPQLARLLASHDEPPTTLPGPPAVSLPWAVAVAAAVLTLLSLAVGLSAGALLCATVVLVALGCQLWCPASRPENLTRSNR